MGNSSSSNFLKLWGLSSYFLMILSAQSWFTSIFYLLAYTFHEILCFKGNGFKGFQLNDKRII